MPWLGTIFGAIDGLIGKLFGDKGGREVAQHTERVQEMAGAHAENIAVMRQFAAEFRSGGTLWDSFIDGLNRLPRPAMALGVFGLLAYAPVDPVGFAHMMNAYRLVPEWLALLVGAIAGFYFAARHLEKRIGMSGPAPDLVRAVLDRQRELNRLRDPMEPRAFDRAMADTGTPLSLPAIEEWNRRRTKPPND